MRFFLQRLKLSLRRAGAWCALFGRRVRHAFSGRLVLAALLGIMTVALYSRYITELKFFVIIEQNRVTVHKTYTRDAGAALAESGIQIGLYDSVSLPDGLLSGKSTEIEIERAVTSNVSVTLDGVTVPVTCLGGTVEDALGKAGYVARPRDIISINPATPVEDGMHVTVTRIEIKTEQDFESIPFDEIVNENPRVNYGATVVTSEGSEGERTYTYEVTLRDGVEIYRTLLNNEVTREPVTRVVEKGTGGTIKLADGTIIPYKKRLDVICTAYTTERQTNKINAIGNIARVGTIAVDPKVIPLRSKVYVSSRNGTWVYGVALCEDTGGNIKNNIIDLYFDTWAECIQFGVKSGYLYILD